MDVSEEMVSTLRAESHGHPPCVMAAGFCTEHSAASRSIGYEEERAPTLRAGVVPAAVYENHSQDTRYTGPLETAPTVSATYGMGGNNQPFVVGLKTYAMTMCGYPQVSREQSPTLTARDFKDPTIVNKGYSVRRLTPTECARLQGFPDWWCAGLETEQPTETDIAFWAEIFEIHRRIKGTASKPKTENQIIKWLQSPHSDSAEYKMWGNGVALPCVFFVLAGIAWIANSVNTPKQAANHCVLYGSNELAITSV